MSEHDREEVQSPLTRPGFIVAAVVLGLVVVLGVVVAIVNATQSNNPPTAGNPAVTQQQDGQAPPIGEGDQRDGGSICGLKGHVPSGKIAAPPEAEWQYQGTTAYPTSKTYGPAKTSPDGFRYCFQHSPEGALFAAANAVVQAETVRTDTQATEKWLKYFVAKGPHREEFISAGPGEDEDDPDSRNRISGFRLLTYKDKQATVDMGMELSIQGKIVNLSMVYDLIWEDGDWKMVVKDPKKPLNVANLPDLSGYISWGEQ